MLIRMLLFLFDLRDWFVTGARGVVYLFEAWGVGEFEYLIFEL